MPRPRALLRVAIAHAVGASLLATAPAAPAAPSAEPARRADPVVGSCYRLTGPEIWADSHSDPPVDCGVTHNALTVAVVTLPAETDWDDEEYLWKKVGPPCYRALDATLGRTARARAMSAYGLVWFQPTSQERADGASWVRCDAVLWEGRSGAPIPDASPLLEQPLTNQVARCLAGNRFYVVRCAQQHTFRATGVARVRFASYPGDRAALRYARRQCPSRVASVRWRYSYPSKTAWKVGHRLLVCYTKTRR